MSAPAGAGVEQGQLADAMRFALPWRTRVAVIGTAAELPELGGARAVQAVPTPSAENIGEHLAAARSDGCEYVLVPRAGDIDAGTWHVIEAACVSVVPEAGGYAVFSLHPRPPEATADGLPLPPAHLIRVTSGCLRQAVNRPEALYDSYLEAGEQGAACIRSALERFGLAIEDFGSVLDFGCGCGRVTRHWGDLPGGVHGCDYNPLLVDWCAEHSGFATSSAMGSSHRCPTPTPRSTSCTPSRSSPTSTSRPELPWMRELTRVVRPGGWS